MRDAPFSTENTSAVTPVSPTPVMSSRPITVSLSSPVSLDLAPTPQPSPEEPYILFANRQLIHRVNLDGSDLKVLINETGSSAIAIDFDIRRNYMFWTVVGPGSIRRARLDGTDVKVLVSSELTSPDGLAWDWINEKLYWTDPEDVEIEVYDPATDHRRSLLSTGASSVPRGLAVDPTTRWLYWTDWGTVAKIERASMDGSARKTLHDRGLFWPNAITVDYDSQTLYWADASLDKIESSAVNGSNRKLVTTAFILHPFDITFYNGTLYWSDWRADSILRTQTSSPDNVDQLFQPLDVEPMGVHVVTRERQPLLAGATNPCSDNNGNCSHFCLLSASDPAGYTCSCPMGFTMTSNGRDCNKSESTLFPSPTPIMEVGSCIAAGYTSCCTEGNCLGNPPTCFCDALCSGLGVCCHDFYNICSSASPTATPKATPTVALKPIATMAPKATPTVAVPTPTATLMVSFPSVFTATPSPTSLSPAPYLIFGNRRRIIRMSLDGSNFRTVVAGQTNVVGVNFDYRQGYIYWTDVTRKTIMRATLKGRKTTTLASSGLEVPDGIAVDWINDKLYWTDASLKHIEVYDQKSGDRKILIKTGNETIPRGIVADPCNRWLYWSDWGSVAKIEKVSMDGKGRKVLHNTSLTWPNAITLDIESQILYWADARLDKVESSNVNGSNRRIITFRGIFHPFAHTVFRDTLFVSDWILDQILAVKIPSPGTSTTTVSLTSRLQQEPMGVQVITPERQPEASNPCGSDNGNCSHLCLLSAITTSGYTCDCPKGLVLEDDQRSCVAIPTPSLLPSVTTPTPTPPPTQMPGSCIAAGYDDCCTLGACEGIPPNCMCDFYCFEFNDCCHDFGKICPRRINTSEVETMTHIHNTFPSPTTTIQLLPTSTMHVSTVQQSPAQPIVTHHAPISSREPSTTHIPQQPSTTHVPQQLSMIHIPQQPSTTHILQQPSTIHILQQPSTIHITRQPSTTHITQQPPTTHITQQPSTTHIPQQPSTTHILQQPSTIHITRQPSTTHITQQPPTTHITQQPSTTHITRQPSTTHITRQPPTTHITQQPPTTHIPQQPSTTHITLQPSTTDITQQPSTTYVTQQSTTTHVTQQSTTTHVTQQSTTTHVTQQSTTTHVTQQSTTTHVIQQSTTTHVTQQSTTTHVIQQSTTTHVIQQPFTTHVIQQSFTTHVIQQPSITTAPTGLPLQTPTKVMPTENPSFASGISVGTVVGILVAVFIFIVVVGTAITIVLVMIIKKMTAFGKYETFQTTPNSRELTSMADDSKVIANDKAAG